MSLLLSSWSHNIKDFSNVGPWSRRVVALGRQMKPILLELWAIIDRRHEKFLSQDRVANLCPKRTALEE